MSAGFTHAIRVLSENDGSREAFRVISRADQGCDVVGDVGHIENGVTSDSLEGT